MLYDRIDQDQNSHDYATSQGVHASRNKNKRFLGYLRIKMNYDSWGFLDSNGNYYTPVIEWTPPMGAWDMDSDNKNDFKTLPYVLFFKGCDDTSYYKRYATIEDRKADLEAMKFTGLTDDYSPRWFN